MLVSLVAVACSSGDGRGNTGSSLSIGDATGESATGGTGSMTGVDTTASLSDGTDSATSAPDDATGTSADSDPSSDGSSGPGPTSCAEDEAACDAWFLPRDAAQWEAVTIGGPVALAPGGPVLAAFDIEEPRIGFVLTADELVRVDLEQRTWVSKTTIADRFPELNVEIFSAYSVPAYWAGMPGAPEGVTIGGSDVAFLYEYDAASDTFAFDQSTVFGNEWDDPGAPVRTDVREMWLDLTNDEGWADHDVSEICPDAQGPVGPHIAVVTDGAVQVLDAGYCFAFFPPVDIAAFAPMGLPGAPPAERIGGVAYNETTGLVVFAEP